MEPPVTGEGNTVCVTGASGFIGSHLVKQLLERGYTVRATVRDARDNEKYGWITYLADGTKGKLELHSADLLQEGSFDAAVEGCDYVCHVAAVLALNVKDPEREVVDPAVKGTQNVIGSVLRAKCAKRVVITSTVAAMADDFQMKGRTYTEDDWHHELSLENAYNMGKTLAEKWAWRAYEEQKARALAGADGGWSFELVAIHPGLVLGDLLHNSHSTNLSVLSVLRMLDGTLAMAPDFYWSISDVRDVALAHVLALEKVEAQGRYIVADDGCLSMLDIAKVIRAEYPHCRVPSMVMPTALLYLVAVINPTLTLASARRMSGRVRYFSNKKAKTDLGISFTLPQKAILDTVTSLQFWGTVSIPSSPQTDLFPALPKLPNIFASQPKSSPLKERAFEV